VYANRIVLSIPDRPMGESLAQGTAAKQPPPLLLQTVINDINHFVRESFSLRLVARAFTTQTNRTTTPDPMIAPPRSASGLAP
jgi:hypothetical protein